jgi:hypothetical protein
LSLEILNPDVVCVGCGTEYTSDGEWVGDTFMCDSLQQYCLNCCGCEDHDTTEEGPWYE